MPKSQFLHENANILEKIIRDEYSKKSGKRIYETAVLVAEFERISREVQSNPHNQLRKVEKLRIKDAIQKKINDFNAKVENINNENYEFAETGS